MAKKYATGAEEMEANIRKLTAISIQAVTAAVEITCVGVMNDGKANHVANQAHMIGRYQNITGNLTASIGPPKIVEANEKRVHGIVPVGMEYAAAVEFGTSINVLTGGSNKPYPYMQPALLAGIGKFQFYLRTFFERSCYEGQIHWNRKKNKQLWNIFARENLRRSGQHRR